ncbi:diguanylate cyclase [Aeromonas sp. R6-1]|uniref:diguanylate cyclase domain-containing protein n=1 Tax=Aeromonas sp. R6-1 TaxID=3138471 RepID=UPI0034A230C0
MNIIDISDSSTLKISHAEEKFRFLFEHSPIGMAMIDCASGKLLEVNSSILKSCGYTREDILNINYRKLIPKKYEDQVIAQIEELNRIGRFGPIDKELIRKDGTCYPVRVSGIILSEVDGRNILWGIIEDISDQKHAAVINYNFTLYDMLTKLPNRNLFTERLNQVIAANKRSARHAALIFIDVDNVKSLNDEYGKSAGDLLLLEVSSRLKNSVRETDTVARFGGAEFVVLARWLSTDKAEATNQAGLIARKLLAALSAPYKFDLGCDSQPDILIEHHCTASIGVAVFNADERDPYDFIEWADSAIYKVEETGGNSILFHDTSD